MPGGPTDVKTASFYDADTLCAGSKGAMAVPTGRTALLGGERSAGAAASGYNQPVILPHLS